MMLDSWILKAEEMNFQYFYAQHYENIKNSGMIPIYRSQIVAGVDAF
jgi:hypothetical protein